MRAWISTASRPRREAVRALAGMAGDMPADVDRHGITIKVRDEAGRSVLTAKVSLVVLAEVV